MVANAAKHVSYGFSGAFFTYGIAILNGFYPGYVFTANYLAGDPRHAIRRGRCSPVCSATSSSMPRTATTRCLRGVR
jgi:hypothetical protein